MPTTAVQHVLLFQNPSSLWVCTEGHNYFRPPYTGYDTPVPQVPSYTIRVRFMSGKFVGQTLPYVLHPTPEQLEAITDFLEFLYPVGSTHQSSLGRFQVLAHFA